MNDTPPINTPTDTLLLDAWRENIAKHHYASIIHIQRWWKKRMEMDVGGSHVLHRIMYYLRRDLREMELQELSNKCHSISHICKGDGAGLLGGALIDMFICRFFQTKLREYEEYHCGESDMKICGIPLSQKKISGKSTVALDWSKNPTDAKKENFNCDMLIINLKTEQWWKSKPRRAKPAQQGPTEIAAESFVAESQTDTLSTITPSNSIEYNQVIPSGIFLVDKEFCKKNILLGSNNKTNTLIDQKSLYHMLYESLRQNLYIEIPKPNKTMEFDILNAFA